MAGALAATLMIVALAYWWSSARKDKSLPVPQSLPANINQQLSGYSFTRSVEGRQIFTVHAARTVAFKQGRTTVLEDVVVEVFGREGNRHDVLRTSQCEYNPQSGDLFSPGSVEIEMNAATGVLPRTGLSPSRPAPRERQPVYLETSQMSFRQQGSLVVTDEPVRFRIGPASGSARGMKYATQQGWVELTKDVVAELVPRGAAPNGAGQQPVRLTANHLRYDSPKRQGGVVALDGPLAITQGSRHVLAERGVVLLDDHNRLIQTILEGNVRALDPSEAGAITGSARRVEGKFDVASGHLRTVLAEGDVVAENRRGGRQVSSNRIVAQQLEISFQGVHPQPQRGSASGNVELSLDSSGVAGSDSSRQVAGNQFSAERKTLSAGQVQFVFRPSGRSLSEAQTVGAGQLVLTPSDPKLGERVVTAGQISMTFDGRSRLKTLRGLSKTRIVFQPPRSAPAGTPSQESSSERMEATFDPSTQTLGQVEQAGDFQFRDGDRRATADRATYSTSARAFTLIGHPEISDANSRMSAEHIFLDLGTDTATGLGKVRSTHFATADRREAGGSSPRPAGAGEPTHVLADRMLAQRRSQVVHYEGHVRAWHGANVVEASSLDVYKNERRVSSGSRVLTSHFQFAPQVQGTRVASVSQRETRPVTIRADRLEYFDQGRKASYRGNVQLQTENTALQADRMDVYFSSSKTANASDIERAVADGHVRVVQPARRATGEHSQYEAAAGKIVVTGGPPTLYDAEKGFTTGQRLTFFLHDDKLFVDGGEESPTLSKHRVAQ